jgi:hypothetical protein
MADQKKGDAGGPDNDDVNDPGKLDDMKKNIEQRANQMRDLEQQLGKLAWQQMAAHQAVAATRADVASLQRECDRAAELKNDAQRAVAQSKMYQQQLDAATQRCLELQQEIRDADAREADLVRQLQTRELLATSRRRRQSRSDMPSAAPADPAGYENPSTDDEPEYTAPVESKAHSYRLAVDLNKLRSEPSAGEEVLILNKATHTIVDKTRADHKGRIDIPVKIHDLLLIMRNPSAAERAAGKTGYEVIAEPAWKAAAV